MKFSLARGALTLAVSLTLASCGGGGGKATFPITVIVSGQVYPGLILSTNGQDVEVPVPANPGPNTSVTVTFPQQIEYGETYNVMPKIIKVTNADGSSAAKIAYPAHQTCSVPVGYPYNLLPSGTAGQLKEIKMYYHCTLNGIPLGGTIKNLKGTGLVLTNGSSGTYTAVPAVDTTGAPTGADQSFTIGSIPFDYTYGVTVLTQPQGQTCTVAKGVGTMTQADEDKGGMMDILVTCSDNPAP
jgi:hypothetical protein